MRVPVSFFISPAGVFSPKTLLLASLTRVFCQRLYHLASPAGAMPAIQPYGDLAKGVTLPSLLLASQRAIQPLGPRLSNHLHSSHPCSGQPLEFYWV